MRLRLDTLELNPVVKGDNIDALEQAKEVEVPPRSAELSVRGELQTGVSLVLHKFGNRSLFHTAQSIGVDLSGSEAATRFSKLGGAQETADDVSAEWWSRHSRETSPMPTPVENSPSHHDQYL